MQKRKIWGKREAYEWQKKIIKMLNRFFYFQFFKELIIALGMTIFFWENNLKTIKLCEKTSNQKMKKLLKTWKKVLKLNNIYARD